MTISTEAQICRDGQGRQPTPGGDHDGCRQGDPATDQPNDTGVYHAIADCMRGLHALADADAARIWPRLAAAAVSHLACVHHAVITRSEEASPVRVLCASDPYAMMFASIVQRGVPSPCLECAAAGQVRLVDDLAGDKRWPDFSKNVVATTPIRSVLSIPVSLKKSGEVLTLCAQRPGAFGYPDQRMGCVFASHAALALQAIHRRQDKRKALGSRDVIGQAKGVLMERFTIDQVSAFTLLVRLAQERGESVLSTARALLSSRKGSLISVASPRA